MTSHRPSRTHLIALAGITVTTALSLTACGGSSGGSGALAAPSASRSAHPTPTPTPGATATSGSSGTTSAGTTSAGTTGGGATGTTAAGATINLTVTQAPSCPSGTNIAYYPGQDVVISWTTTGATGVDLNVDGSPGVYGSYGPSGSQDLGFPCDGSPNTIRTHTYTITTKGGAVVSKTVSASARVNEITSVSSGPSAAPDSAPASATPSP